MPPRDRYSAIPSRQGCNCPEPVGDPREATCILCGHQVAGKPLPAKALSFNLASDDRSSFAQKTRKYRPAA